MQCLECGAAATYAKGLCHPCYDKKRRTSVPGHVPRPKGLRHGNCAYCGEYGPIQAKGYCKKCYARFLAKGTPAYDAMPDKVRTCAYCGETKEILAKDLCAACYQRQLSTGSCEYTHVRKLCTIPGCNDFSVARGLCEKHRTRLRNHGDPNVTLRPKDWGLKGKHPLYNAWIGKRRDAGIDLCGKWRNDFWAFVKDIGVRPDDGKYKLSPIDRQQPLGPDNYEWVLCYSSANSEEARAKQRLAVKEWSRTNPEAVKNQSLRKQFGITIEQYRQMEHEQGGVCALCGQPETTIHRNKKGEVQSLAVDHCHTTKKVRGLLCANCNKGLGCFGDSTERLQQAIDYLKKHSS